MGAPDLWHLGTWETTNLDQRERDHDLIRISPHERRLRLRSSPEDGPWILVAKPTSHYYSNR
jgi:hypothetical protein